MMSNRRMTPPSLTDSYLTVAFQKYERTSEPSGEIGDRRWRSHLPSQPHLVEESWSEAGEHSCWGFALKRRARNAHHRYRWSLYLVHLSRSLPMVTVSKKARAVWDIWSPSSNKLEACYFASAIVSASKLLSNSFLEISGGEKVLS